VSKRRPLPPSEAQQNADALYRRTYTYAPENATSINLNWDWRKRQPRDLREAVSMARQLHAAEVPSKLHEGPDSIGPDGTPRMTVRAEGYIFGSGTSDDAPRNPETNERDPVGYYHAPFRARLAEMTGDHYGRCVRRCVCKGGQRIGKDDRHHHFKDCPAGQPWVPCNDVSHKRAAIVQHVTIGAQSPVEAAIAEGVPSWCARLVAEDALRAFLHSMSDMKFHLPAMPSETVTAA
jgi:hypothetical protein